MNRFLACAVLALGLAACGGRNAQDTAAVAPAPPADKPAAVAAAPAAATVVESAAATGPSDDGESVDNATASVSPIAAAVAANTPVPSADLPAKWKLGENYAPLPAAQPVSVEPGEVEVTEIFWYGCGHCFTLEPRLESWEKNEKPAYVKLVRMPVVWNEVAREDARLFYTIEALGKLDQLNLDVFRELHVNRNPLTVVAGNRVDPAATERKAREFLLTKGVTAEDFARTYRSFAIESKLRQAENLSRRYLADHTPMVVVQGKYMTDVSMAGGMDQLFELINDLAAREHAAR
jgi:thiol:disulfide interchange protein DsbA